MKENFTPQKLTPSGFEPFYNSQEVDAKSLTLATQAFELLYSRYLLTTQAMKSYFGWRLTELNLENQIYQRFQLRAIAIN